MWYVRTAKVDKRVLSTVCSTSLYHFRQCGIVLKSRSDRIDYIVIFYDARLQPKVTKTLCQVQAECGLEKFE